MQSANIYIFIIISTNFCFQNSRPDTAICDPNSLKFQLAYALNDSVCFIVYLFLNTYIWPYGAVIWCSFPKVFWGLCYYFLHTDRKSELIIYFAISVFINWVHVTMCEEILLAVHRGQKGRLIACGSNVEIKKDYKVEKIIGFNHPPLCFKSAFEYFISINLDIVYITQMVILNIQETLL